jgi:hypothetical protein
VKALTHMNFERSAADPCFYYCWKMCGFVVSLSWIDDFLVDGDTISVEAAKEQMKSIFECDTDEPKRPESHPTKSVLACVYAVSIQNQITTAVP